ncbi:MAG: pyridoxamine 5'-phosphate oxidase family protein [Chitinophagaceae bacterium]
MNQQQQTGITINNLFYTLEDIEKDCWIRLMNGALKSKDAFHVTSVATFNNDSIDLRTVVLRKVLPNDKVVRFHTDIRSHKWSALQKNNTISLLFYDAASRIQIRLKGKAYLHYSDTIAMDAWQNTVLSSRRCYLATQAPSSVIDYPTSGLSEKFELHDPTVSESELGKNNFGVVSIKVASLDWLWLHHSGHRRAYFDYLFQSLTWLIP